MFNNIYTIISSAHTDEYNSIIKPLFHDHKKYTMNNNINREVQDVLHV